MSIADGYGEAGASSTMVIGVWLTPSCVSAEAVAGARTAARAKAARRATRRALVHGEQKTGNRLPAGCRPVAAPPNYSFEGDLRSPGTMSLSKRPGSCWAPRWPWSPWRAGCWARRRRWPTTPCSIAPSGPGPPTCATRTAGRAASGGGAGQFTFPYGTTVSGGEVYVVDGNHRVSVYATDGTFRRAFGKGVNASGSGDPDICTRATTCKAGSQGGAAGQLNTPYAVAVSGGEVYVADAGNNRVAVYSTAGSFARAFGKNVNPGGADPDLCVSSCQAGSSGPAPGQLSLPARPDDQRGRGLRRRHLEQPHQRLQHARRVHPVLRRLGQRRRAAQLPVRDRRQRRRGLRRRPEQPARQRLRHGR